MFTFMAVFFANYSLLLVNAFIFAISDMTNFPVARSYAVVEIQIAGCVATVKLCGAH